jgi:hypothetical protein
MGRKRADFYMASENQEFTGASWLPFSAAPVLSLSPLSMEIPTKTVHFKVKNANGESTVKSDDIHYLLATDGDGIPDSSDNDKDIDGIPDPQDIEPNKPTYIHGTSEIQEPLRNNRNMHRDFVTAPYATEGISTGRLLGCCRLPLLLRSDRIGSKGRGAPELNIQIGYEISKFLR